MKNILLNMSHMRVDDCLKQQKNLSREDTTCLTPLGEETLSKLSYYINELRYLLDVIKEYNHPKAESILKVMLERAEGKFETILEN